MASNNLLDDAVDIAYKTIILPIEGYTDEGVTIEDYLDYTALDAVELGVVLTEKYLNGEPKFHWYSDIRGDEHEDTCKAILRPVVKAVLEFYKSKESND